MHGSESAATTEAPAPNYAYQFGSRESFEAMKDQCIDEAKQAGATWLRGTKHETLDDLFLMEFWNVRPEIEPEPFFFLSAESN